jgi:hypothetical protein
MMKDRSPSVRTSLLRDMAVTCLGTLLIMLPTIVNGFPLVFSDTGTYLLSAFEGVVPADRPYWYGGFIKCASLNGSWLMGVVVVQALLCSLYARAVMRTVLPRSEEWRTLLVFCAIAGPFTGLGWYAGQLMPDILTPIGAMAMFLLLTGERSWMERIAHVLVITLCAWCHSSNLLILPITGACVIAVVAGRSWTKWRSPLARWSIAVLCAWGGLYFANGIIDGKPYLSRGSHVFLMGRLIDTGMLEPLLLEECPTHHWRICEHVDSLPETGRQFLWWDSSPLHEMGGWDATREEYGEITRASFATPGRLWWHAKASLASTGEQLIAWHLGYEIESKWYRDPGSPPATVIAKHLPHELTAFHGAMQQGGRGELSLRWPNIGYRIVLSLSLLVLAGWAWKRSRPGRKEEVPLVVMCLATVLVGAWVCASLSEVDARYLARVSWLLPMAAAVVITRWLSARS